MPSRLLCHYRTVIKLYFKLDDHTSKKKEEKRTMADSLATPSRSGCLFQTDSLATPSRSGCLFQTDSLATQSRSRCLFQTDSLATPSRSGCLFQTDSLATESRSGCLFQAFAASSASSSAVEGCKDIDAYWKILWIPLLLKKGGAPGWISFCKFCCKHGTM